MRLTQQDQEATAIEPSRTARLWHWLKDDAGAIAIEYVIVAIALLAIAGAIAAALTTLGNDAVEQIPGSVSEAGG
ncbi:MAG: hypothetical protein ACR2QK_18950 [Acidimicrobiales bacterium]